LASTPAAASHRQGDESIRFRSVVRVHDDRCPHAQNVSLTDAAAPRVYSALSPGNYSVTETLPVAGWDLANLVCNDANGSVNLATGTANIVLDANEDVTCTYTNTQRGSLTIQKVTDP
jgi:hypothetical protein